MKSLPYICAIVFAAVLSSCDESPTNSGGTSDGMYEMTIFVDGYSSITVPVYKRINDNTYPSLDYVDDPYFYASTVYSPDTSRMSVRIQIYGHQLTPGPIHRTLVLRYDSEVVYIPIKVNVVDFYYVTQMFSNVADTLILKKGTTFLLQIGCKDSAGNIVSQRKVYSLASSMGYGIQGDSRDKVTSQQDWRDTTYFSFLISAYPNITPSPSDAGMSFRLSISNKVIDVPIKLTY